MATDSLCSVGLGHLRFSAMLDFTSQDSSVPAADASFYSCDEQAIRFREEKRASARWSAFGSRRRQDLTAAGGWC